MADLQITQLNALAKDDVQSIDPLAIVDDSASSTKKITVVDLVHAGVGLIPDDAIPSAKIATLETNQVASAAIQSSAVTNVKIETSTSSTTGIDGGAKIRAGSITVDRLDATKFDRGLTVVNSKLGVGNSITANTTGAAKVKYDAQGLITGTASLAATDLPKATASAVGAVSVPTSGKLSVDSNGELSIAVVSGLAANQYTKVTVNTQGQVTAATSLGAADLPAATTSAKGAVIVPSSGGLTVDGSGNLSLAGQTAFTADQSYTKVTVNAKGIITATGSLADTDLPNHSAAKLTTGTLPAARIGTGSINSDRIDTSAVTNAKIETSSSATTGIDGSTKLRDGTVTVDKLDSSKFDRGLSVVSSKLGITNAVSGGASTRSGISYDAQGLITGTIALAASDLPKATTSAIGAVSVGTGLSVNGSGVLTITNSVTGAQVSGITFNNQGLITAATGLVAGDLPTATTSAKGAVQITSGGGLTVDGSGNLITSTSGVSAGTYQSVTVNTKGVVTAGAALTASLIPVLDASKITTGSLAAARIGTDTIDGSKLSNSSTTIFQSIAQAGYPTAQFSGQLLFDTVSEDAFIWDGTAWQAITTLTKGSLVYGGTFNATTSKMVAATSAGIAAGLVVGSNLPTASENTDGVYVVVSIAGTPSSPAPVVALSPPDYILGVTNTSGSSWQEIDLSATVAGQVASNITFTPYGQLSATNVQDALQELETEKMGLAGGTCTGQLLISNTGSIVFEGATVDAYELTLAVADPTLSDKTITFPDITGTLITSGDTNTVTSTMVDGSLVNANLSATAAIAFSKLAALTSAQILVGNGSNVATGVTVTGDISINNAGLTAIASGVIVDGDISGSAAITGSKIATGTTSAVGVLQLTDSTSSTSATTAATPNAVKSAYDLANAALPKGGGTATGHILIDNDKEVRFYEADGNGSAYVGIKGATDKGSESSYTISFPAAAPTANKILKANSSTPTTLEWADDATVSAAGSNTQVQYNNSGVFGASASLTFNSTTGALTATSFVGDLTGTASSFTVTANNSTDETVYPLFADGATGSQGAETDTGLTYNPSTGLLTSTGFSGSGANLTTLNASNLSSGTVATARLGTGTASSANFLRGDGAWAAPEGTAIISTGESGGTKFLREDGDGSCSWQSVPAGISLSGSTDNTIATVTGANALQGEANLTYDGNTLALSGNDNQAITIGASADLTLKADGSNSAIAHNGDGDLIIKTDGTGEDVIVQAKDLLVFRTDGNNERMRIDSSGRLLVGLTASRAVNSAQGSFQIEGTGAEDSDMSIVRNQASSGGPALCFGKSRNASLGGNTVVNDDDQLGALIFTGNDGTDLASQGARIDAYVDGTPGSNDMPGRLVFSTTADGAASSTERMRITNTGAVKIGTTIESASAATNLVVHTPLSSSNANSIEITQNTNGANKAAAGIGIAIANGGASTNAADLYFSTATNGSLGEKLRIKENGALGIAGANYGTSGQVLTSGGASAAPTWADAAGGGSVEATASGAITAGQGVLVNSSGQFTKVTETISTNNPITSLIIEAGQVGERVASNITQASNVAVGDPYQEGGYNGIAYDKANQVIVCAYGYGNTPRLVPGLVKTTGIEWRNDDGGQVDRDGGRESKAVCQTGDSIFVWFWRDGSMPKCQVVKQTTASPVRNTLALAFQGSAVSIAQGLSNDQIDYQGQVVHIGSGKMIFCWYNPGGGQTSIYYAILQVSDNGNGTTITRTSNGAQVDSDGGHYMRLIQHSGGKMILLFQHKGGNDQGYAKYCVGTVGSTSVTWTSKVTLWNHDCEWDSVNLVELSDGRLLSTVQNGSNCEYRIGTLSGTSISWTTATTLSGIGERHEVQTDPATKLPVFSYRDGTNCYLKFVTISSNTLTLNSTALDLGGWDGTYAYTLFDRRASLHALPDVGQMVSIGRQKANNQNRYQIISASHVVGTASTDLTANNYVGIATASFTNGQTAKANVVGGVNTAVSGLDPASKYYVQNNGTLGKAETSTVAGLALSATKLLVKE